MHIQYYPRVSFLDLHDPAGGIRVEPGADLTALFSVPLGNEPTSITLIYEFTETWEKGSNEAPKQARLEVELPETP